MPKCVILVGLPATGKSTHIERNYPYAKEGKFYWHVSTDKVIENIASIYGMTYNESFKKLYKFAKEVMWREMETARGVGANVVIDRTNLTRKSRKKFIDFFSDYIIECVVFTIPKDWNDRLFSRVGKVISKDVLENMEDSYEPPKLEEGFASITYMHS